ncbi:serine/threonine-protein kinase HipA [Brevibacterium sanguinis]|uniref:Serine/threonine-protein kinase HipA n=2 Tax=Brevibacterium TaxID=1696 RepID=A0A366IFE2_9MICO|nr:MULTISPECIES: type II toxin-antitoxin system HipA family toxin [Brevibacterium]RBP61251.1 serine/threonine-protein kinase HipA [Brevibacterium sanguinis]RBP68452.1 serine/threonine-protein kinase HipA [Brevibacterium celere]
MSEKVFVDMDVDGVSLFVGTAYFHVARSQISTTFSYSTEYLTSRSAFPIDPALPLSAAPFSLPGLPGAFDDCAPDRWGRNLVANQHQRATANGTLRGRRLTDVDYLLGVSDATRQGALRFRRQPEGEYLGSGSHIPRLLSLPELQHAADDAVDGSEVAIKRLLDAGTGSLGGARPKAAVMSDDAQLMLAKFSRPTDPWNVIAWEKVALELAAASGISVPRTRLLRIDGRPVLLLARFDREHQRRIGYISAMTAVQRKDGEPGDYVDLVEAVEDISRNWRAGCSSLFRRVAFSVAIRNTDDHLRNHGLLRVGPGWELSPAFDLNPEPDLDVERQTAIIGATAATDETDALLEFGGLCHLRPDAAREILAEVIAAVEDWRTLAGAAGISPSEQNDFGDAFTTQLGRLRTVLRAPL